MDPEITVADLVSRNEELRRENERLRTILSVLKENMDLKDNVRSFQSGKVLGRQYGLCRKSVDESQFRKDMKHAPFPHRTSSPIDFKSFIQNSVYPDPSEQTDLQRSHVESPVESNSAVSLLGEIAYQLDRRILSHIFQGQDRLYGFTLLNIPAKIVEVSTHPLTGKVDQGYRRHLTQRYEDLMEYLHQLGYKAALHPAFSEFVVNTYGILRERPGENSNPALDYNNPDALRSLIMEIAPGKLQKDLLLILSCLCSLAERDKRPLLIS